MKQKERNNLTKKSHINHKEEISADFFDYYDNDEPYQEIQIT